MQKAMPDGDEKAEDVATVSEDAQKLFEADRVFTSIQLSNP